MDQTDERKPLVECRYVPDPAFTDKINTHLFWHRPGVFWITFAFAVLAAFGVVNGFLTQWSAASIVLIAYLPVILLIEYISYRRFMYLAKSRREEVVSGYSPDASREIVLSFYEDSFAFVSPSTSTCTGYDRIAQVSEFCGSVLITTGTKVTYAVPAGSYTIGSRGDLLNLLAANRVRIKIKAAGVK